MSRTYAYNFYKTELLAQATRLLWEFCVDGPPYDPFKVASGLGVGVELRRLQGLDGYTESRETKTYAVINLESPETRQRFTLAHELGHVILFRIAQSGLKLNFRRDKSRGGNSFDHQDPAEEALCNEFAAALLMPRDEVRDKVARQRITPNLVLNIANTFAVSMHASARRLVSLSDPTCIGISYWQVLEPEWAIPFHPSEGG